MIERPLEPIEKEKCYVFKAKVFATVEGYVWASSPEEAQDLINNREFDELDRINIDEIEEIETLGEE